MRATIILALVTCLLFAGCGSDSGDSGTSGSMDSAKAKSPASPDRLDISGFKYKPKMITVKAGTKVAFTNADSATHTATSKTKGAFDSGDIGKGQTKPVTFRKPGDFTYYCVYHAFMTGKVKVTR